MTTQAKTGVFCWFELPYDEEARAHKFYSELFGWDFTELSKEPIPVWGIQGAEAPADAPAQPMIGGMLPRQHPMHGPMLYFRVPSVDEWAQKVEELGGEVLIPKMEAGGGYGFFAACQDTEGNHFALWEEA
jgi:uncharacterized protein